MKSLLRRLALIAALLSELPARCIVRGDVLDIILRSNGSMHSGSSVKGLSIDLINGSTTSLEAVSRMDVSTFTQFRLTWHKDGDVVNAPLMMRRVFCEGKNATVRCSLNLSISAVNGIKSGNYSVKLVRSTLVIAAAYVKVVFGDAQAVSFTDYPTGVVNCSSENSSVALSYSAVGFPAPMYKLTCGGWQYTSEPSITGKFVIPPEVCCAGAVCTAVAFNEYETKHSANVVVREQPIGPVCRQHVGCLTPLLEVFVQSCTSAGSGSIVNGRSISSAADDSTAALEAIVYQNISSFVQLRLDWLKDGLLVNTSLNARRRNCDGDPSWGSWMLCRLRLPLSAVNGNRSGNYTVTLRTTALVASAWVVVNVVGQGSQNCSSNSGSLASPSVSPRFPFTCYNYSQTPAFDNNDSVTMSIMEINAMAVTAEASLSNSVSLIVSTVTLGTMVVAAILAYVMCKRAGSFHKQITQKYFTVPSKNRYRNDSVVCSADPSSFAAPADSDLDHACIEHSRDVGSLGGLLLEQTTPHLRWTGTLSNAADVEIDGVVTSVMAESASHNEGASLPSAFAWNQYVDQQPPASAERSIVHDASTYAVESEHKPSITLIIHAENVQVGSNNTMFVQKSPWSSAADSAYGSTQDTDSCSSTSPAFDECGLARDSADLLLPESHYSSQVEQQSWSSAPSFSLDLPT